jgi:TorA specific chaperone
MHRTLVLFMGEAMLLCEFLARVFSAPPDATFVGSCRHGVGAALLATFADDDDLRPEVQQMMDALGEPLADDMMAGVLDRLYTRLFSGVAGPETVSLFASAHLEGRLFGDATARMDATLAELGMSVAADSHEPADHLAIQLAVLCELLRRDDTTIAQRFADKQMCNWVPMFANHCRSRDPGGFYAGAATLVDHITSAHATASRAAAA